MFRFSSLSWISLISSQTESRVHLNPNPFCQILLQRLICIQIDTLWHTFTSKCSTIKHDLLGCFPALENRSSIFCCPAGYPRIVSSLFYQCFYLCYSRSSLDWSFSCCMTSDGSINGDTCLLKHNIRDACFKYTFKSEHSSVYSGKMLSAVAQLFT